MRKAIVAVALPIAGCAALATTGTRDLTAQRAAMVARLHDELIAADPQTDDAYFTHALAAVGATRREDFVQPAGRRIAYFDVPQQIGFDQTISSPRIVAIMTGAARVASGATVLDVGTGSGYQAAILSRLGARVTSLEIVPGLARAAAARLDRLGYRGIEVHAADGFLGWAPRAPFDAIIVAAGAAAIPPALVAQLKPGGRLVMPIGPSTVQEQLLVVAKDRDSALTRCSLGATMFVPLTGRGARAATLRGLIDRAIPGCYAGPLT